jgi:hypothetical protein
MFVLKKNIQIEQESITFNTSKDVFGPPFFTFNSCMDKLFVDFGCERRIYVIPSHISKLDKKFSQGNPSWNLHPF